ncbi:hypothetical protein UlMin_028005 [Ulmus minor]
MSNGDVVLDIQNQEHLSTLTPANQNPTQEHVPTDEDCQTSLDQSLISTLQNEIEKSTEEFDSRKKITKIQWIPRIMKKEEFRDYYRQRAMKIGPLRPYSEDKLKLKLAAQYIRNSDKTSNELLVSIKKEIETLSTCFHNEVLKYNEVHDVGTDSYNRWLRYLARMLLVDGCSILQFIYCRVWDKLKELQIDNGQASMIEQDLFLMQNQIPFQVLEILMDQLPRVGAFSRTVLQKSIDNFIGMNLMTPENVLKRSYLDFFKEKHPVHLLDILRSGLLYGFDTSNIGRSRDRRSRDPSSKNDSNREYFCNIQQLKAAGIKMESSGTSCLGDVTFTSFGWFRARLKLPPLIVNDATGRKLWNLIAYEMCPENYNSDYGVTSYVSLLDSLIDNEEDVKELRSARILRNQLSTDKEVVELFNEIGYNTVSDQAYHQVKQRIQRHCDSLWPTTQFLIVQFKQEYFRNPWSFIALLGSIAVLALTATQTYFTINPTK